MMKHTIARTLSIRVLALGLCLGASATGLLAQTRFALPDTSPDYSRYKTSEECIAATHRIADSVERSLPFWRDSTFKLDTEEFDPLPTVALTAAKKCMSQFDAKTVSLDEYANWVRGFLLANRDADAQIVGQRELQTINATDPDADTKQFQVMGKLLDTYIHTKPVRRQTVETLLKRMEASQSDAPLTRRIRMYYMALGISKELNDTALEHQVAQRSVDFVNHLSPTERHSPAYDTLGKYMAQRALDVIAHRALIDSLRRGPAAYVALKQSDWAKASGLPGSTLHLPIGKHAPPIQGTFWFQPGADSGTVKSISAPVRPAPGHIGLVIFIDGGCRRNTPVILKGRPTYSDPFMNCWDTYAILKRFKKEFPALQITVVAHTTGYIGDTPPMTPKEEADTLAYWWLGWHRLPVTLAVYNTQFFRLPPPDNRRIDKPIPTEVQYGFGTGRVGVKSAVIVDTDGEVIHSGGLNRDTEEDFKEILQAAMSRAGAQTSSTGAITTGSDN